MTLKSKAFIYRFFAIFGLSIYLAKKEENEYINSLPIKDNFMESISRGSWQARHGFTTVWTKNILVKIKHAFGK